MTYHFIYLLYYFDRPFDYGSIHITDVSSDELRSLMSREHDFSNLQHVQKYLSGTKPGMNQYYYATKEAYQQDHHISNLPHKSSIVIGVIIVPTKFGHPTLFVDCDEKIHPFEKFGYEWVLRSDRVYYLRCEKSQALPHSQRTPILYIPVPSDSDKNNFLRTLTIPYKDRNGTDQQHTWTREDGRLHTCLKQIVGEETYKSIVTAS